MCSTHENTPHLEHTDIKNSSEIIQTSLALSVVPLNFSDNMGVFNFSFRYRSLKPKPSKLKDCVSHST